MAEQSTFKAMRCPATGEYCGVLEDEVNAAVDPNALRKTLGAACREGMFNAKLALTEVECGLDYMDQLENERVAHEAAEQVGVQNA